VSEVTAQVQAPSSQQEINILQYFQQHPEEPRAAQAKEIFKAKGFNQ